LMDVFFFCIIFFLGCLVDILMANYRR